MGVLQALAEMKSKPHEFIHKETFHMAVMPTTAGVRAVLEPESSSQMTPDNFFNSELI